MRVQTKAIIAEDDPITLRMISSLLFKWGFLVIECQDGEQAWEALRVSNGSLLVVLDWVMPAMSGLEVAKKIRALGETRAGYIYIIMLTGRKERADMVEAMQSGVDDFLTKPFDPEELRMTIRTGQRIIDAASKQLELAEELRLKTNILENLYEDLDAKVRERTMELDVARKRAEESSRLKSEFLANMSHEIRTPLNGIISYIDLLLDGDIPEDVRSDVHVVKTSAHSLKQIINDVLDLSKVEAGQLFIDPHPFNVSSMISDTTDVVEILAHEKDLTLAINRAAHVPEQLIGDKARIQQVTTNLLSNAIKFAPEHGAVVIHLDGDSRGNFFDLEISVSDTGIGIPEDRHQAIFEAFQQADGSTTRKYGGTGLGLTICRRLLDLMDGSITLKSKVGIGTCFSFRVPCGTPERETAPAREQEEDKALDFLWSDLPSLSILLADDHVVNRSALTRLLSRKGHTVSTAGSGKEVLTALEGQTFDLILMDVQMPEMGGDRATQIIRESDTPWNKVPIIALTANAFDTERMRLLELGMNAFVAKPVEQKDLVKALSSCIEERD